MPYRLIHYPGGNVLHDSLKSKDCDLHSLVTAGNYVDYDTIEEVPKPFQICENCMEK